MKKLKRSISIYYGSQNHSSQMLHFSRGLTHEIIHTKYIIPTWVTELLIIKVILKNASSKLSDLHYRKCSRIVENSKFNLTGCPSCLNSAINLIMHGINGAIVSGTWKGAKILSDFNITS